MADYFFDSSGLTKRYAREVGSAWVENITDLASGNTIFIAEITQVEVTAAIARKMRSGLLNSTDGNLAFAKLRTHSFGIIPSRHKSDELQNHN